MSTEIVLFIIALIVLPVIQQLLRPRSPGSRDQNEDEQVYAEPPAQRPEPAKPPTLEQRPMPVPPRQPGLPLHGLPAAAAKETTPPRLAPVLAAAALTVRPSVRPRLVVAGLRTTAALRRSIVLMTILGPCRAIDPQE